MAHHRGWCRSRARKERARNAKLHRDERRLEESGVAQRALRRRRIDAGGVERSDEPRLDAFRAAAANQRFSAAHACKRGVAAHHRVAEYQIIAEETAPHVRMLGALPGEDESDAQWRVGAHRATERNGGARRRAAVRRFDFVRRGVEAADELHGAARRHCDAMRLSARVVATAQRERRAKRGQVDHVRPALDPPREAARSQRHRGSGVSREHKEFAALRVRELRGARAPLLVRARPRAGARARHLLQHDVRIRPAEAWYRQRC